MKKLTEHKELEAKDFLTIDEDKIYLLWEGENKEGGVLDFVTSLTMRGGKFFFENYQKGKPWPRCAEITERYPRDTPEGVPKLPENMPFLAYVEKFIPDESSLFDQLISGPTYWNSGNRWIKVNASYNGSFTYHIAIDVSTKWAAEKFPEIVEAMEYEAVYTRRYSDVNLKDNGMGYRATGAGYLIGHKLGGQYYDLDWNEVSSIDNLFLKPEDVFGGEEPPDYEEWDKQVNAYPFETSLAFEAGKARGRWEALQEPKNFRN